MMGGAGVAVCACWVLLDSVYIKDAWLLQGRANITIMHAPSSSTDAFAVFGCDAAGSMLIDAKEFILECFSFIQSQEHGVRLCDRLVVSENAVTI